VNPKLDGDFAGTVSIANTASAPLSDETVAVKAIVDKKGVLLIDPTRQLSANGTVYYPLADDSQGYYEAWLSIPSGASADAKGEWIVNFRKKAGPLTISDGSVTGEVSATIQDAATIKDINHASEESPTTYRFTLKRVGDTSEQDCTSATCGANQYCDTRVHRCVAGSKPVTRSGKLTPVTDTVQLPRIASFKTATANALYTAAKNFDWTNYNTEYLWQRFSYWPSQDPALANRAVEVAGMVSLERNWGSSLPRTLPQGFYDGVYSAGLNHCLESDFFPRPLTPAGFGRLWIGVCASSRTGAVPLHTSKTTGSIFAARSTHTETLRRQRRAVRRVRRT
jgi:hypothetical protein